MLAFLNGFSPMHILLVMVVALLLFGNRLPEVARSLGRSYNEFRRGLKDIKEDLDDEPDDAPAQRLDTPRTEDDAEALHGEPARKDEAETTR